MAEFPVLPLFTDALLADCGHLTNEEMGIYIRLLMLMWRSPACRIPNDWPWIERRLGPRAKIEPIIEEFCQRDGNHFSQKRLAREFRYVNDRAQKMSAAAKSRWQKEKDPCKCNAPYPTLPNKIKPPTPKPVDNSENSGREREGFPSQEIGGGGWARADVQRKLGIEALAEAKRNAPGWDVYRLMGLYAEGIGSGRRGPPANLDRAFPAWCLSFTKGKRPS